MLTDLESDLGSLLDHPGRVALLTGVLRVLPTEAHATADGGVDSLLTAPPRLRRQRTVSRSEAVRWLRLPDFSMPVRLYAGDGNTGSDRTLAVRRT